jgi:hypothetical protein
LTLIPQSGTKNLATALFLVERNVHNTEITRNIPLRIT